MAFLPFPPLYACFHERILAELINDPTSALPYWSWDSPPGIQMPAIYADSTSTRYDAKRNAKHLPPTVINKNKEIGFKLDDFLINRM